MTATSPEDLKALIRQLDEDRAWLLQEIDGGRWSQLRFDLAALERELGQLLTRVGDLEEEAEQR